MAAHLVEHGALRGQDVPVGLVRRMRAIQHFQRLIIVSGFRQRAPIGAKYGLVVRRRNRGFLKDRNGLGTLSGRAQRLRIA